MWEDFEYAEERWRRCRLGDLEASYRPGRGPMPYRIIEWPTRAQLLNGAASGITEARLERVLAGDLVSLGRSRTSELPAVE